MFNGSSSWFECCKWNFKHIYNIFLAMFLGEKYITINQILVVSSFLFKPAIFRLSIWVKMDANNQ